MQTKLRLKEEMLISLKYTTDDRIRTTGATSLIHTMIPRYCISGKNLSIWRLQSITQQNNYCDYLFFKNLRVHNTQDRHCRSNVRQWQLVNDKQDKQTLFFV